MLKNLRSIPSNVILVTANVERLYPSTQDDSLQDLCEKLEERTDKKLHLNLIHLI